MRHRTKYLLPIAVGAALLAGSFMSVTAQESAPDAEAADQADSIARQKAAAAQAEYESHFGGPPTISEEEAEMGAREFEEPGDIPDFVREQVGDAALVKIYCAMTKWKTGDLFLALKAADQEVRPIIDAAAKLGVTVAMPDTASIKAEAERRIQAVCAAKTVDEANGLVLDFQAWGKTGMDDQMKATRADLQAKMAAKGAALGKEITDFVAPLAEDESTKMSAYMQSQAKSIASQYQKTFEGRTSAPSESEIAAVRAEIRRKLNAIAAAEEPKIRARIEAQVEAKFGETKKQLEDFGKLANGIGARIRQYIEAHRNEYDQYRDEALKLRRDTIVSVLETRLAEVMSRLEDARSEIDEARKNDPTLPTVDEIKAELEKDSDALAAKLDAALKAGDERALQGHLGEFEAKWDSYRSLMEARALGSVSNICGKALAQLAPVKQKMSDNIGRIDSLLDSCSGDTGDRCLKVGEFAPRLGTLASKLDDLRVGITTIEAICGSPDTTDAKTLTAMLKRLESDGNAVKVFGEALEAEKAEVIAESAADACAQVLPQLRAGMAEINKNEIARIEAELAKCKRTGVGLCADDKITGHLARINPLIADFTAGTAKAEAICASPDEDNIMELRDLAQYLKGTGEKLRWETGTMKYLAESYGQPTMANICRSATAVMDHAKQGVSRGLTEMKTLIDGCKGQSDPRCAAILGNSDKFTAIERKTGETLDKMAGIYDRCRNPGSEEADDAFLTALGDIKDDEAEIKKMADDLKGTVDMTWPTHIKSGKSFKVVLDVAPSKFDDSQWTGDWRTDQMGTIRGGDTYTLAYASAVGWKATGYNEGKAASGTWTYRAGEPDKFQLDIWGRVYEFDDKGNVYDPDYGLVGHLTK